MSVSVFQCFSCFCDTGTDKSLSVPVFIYWKCRMKVDNYTDIVYFLVNYLVYAQKMCNFAKNFEYDILFLGNG